MARDSRRRGRPDPKRRPSAGGTHDGVPDLYFEMLSEAVASSPSLRNDDGRPIKRRKTAKEVSAVASRLTLEPSKDRSVSAEAENSLLQQQTVYDSSEGTDDSNENWEEIELQKESRVSPLVTEGDSITHDISVILGHADPKRHKSHPRARNAFAVEKKLRLDIHKVHLLCLLMHGYIRNAWCNDAKTQEVLRALLTTRARSYLNPEPNLSQFGRSRSFVEGLEQVADIWRAKFTVTARGLRKPTWANQAVNLQQCSAASDVERLCDRNSFQASARKLRGSRDVGAQLLCTLLREAGVDARLVCSLQPLPYATVAKGSTPQKPKPKVVFAGIDNDQRDNESTEASAPEDSDTASVKSHLASGTTQNRLRRRIGQPGSSLSRNLDPGKSPPLEIKRKKILESPYPVFWVEAFNEAIQQWIPVDALVTHTVAKPSRFEPPGSDDRNSMSYVVAFEDDGTVKDVTRRYAKAYNAKTRKSRVENTEGGERWWRRVLKMFRRRSTLDREQVEDAELAGKEATEPMPRNVQDFKNHPYYALERHLKRNEVIHPKREVGKVSAGKVAATELEPVYRRRDVVIVKSVDKWYRLGREVKSGEQPLKFAAWRRSHNRANDRPDTDREAEEPAGVGLYAHFQTELYTPPPIVRGLVPKNAYGNLDVYVPSMIPLGGVHLHSPEAAKAARLAGVDYADAVTGFEFRGRHGTAIIHGIIVAIEFKEAVEAVVSALEQEKQEAVVAKRSREALGWWKRFIVGLRVLERVKEYEMDDNQTLVPQEVEETNEETEEETHEETEEETNEEMEEEGGGFFRDARETDESKCTSSQNESRHNQGASLEEIETGGGFLTYDDSTFQKVSFRAQQLSERYMNEATDILPRICGHEASERHAKSEEQNRSLQEGFDEGGGFIFETIDTQDTPTPRSHPETNWYNRRATSPRSNPSSSSYNVVGQRGHAYKPASPFAPTSLVSGTNGNSPGAASPIASVGDEADSFQDEGSLLSHDPEDDDAEPEWLAHE